MKFFLQVNENPSKPCESVVAVEALEATDSVNSNISMSKSNMSSPNRESSLRSLKSFIPESMLMDGT